MAKRTPSFSLKFFLTNGNITSIIVKCSATCRLLRGLVKWYDRGLQNLWREFDSLIPCSLALLKMPESLDFTGISGIFVFPALARFRKCTPKHNHSNSSTVIQRISFTHLSISSAVLPVEMTKASESIIFHYNSLTAFLRRTKGAKPLLIQ